MPLGLVNTKRRIRFAGDIDLEPISRLPGLLRDGLIEHDKRLEEQFIGASPQDREYLEDVSADERAYAEAVDELIGALMILATHKTAELSVRRILSLGFPDIKPKRIHRIDLLTSDLKGMCSRHHYASRGKRQRHLTPRIWTPPWDQVRAVSSFLLPRKQKFSVVGALAVSERSRW